MNSRDTVSVADALRKFATLVEQGLVVHLSGHYDQKHSFQIITIIVEISNSSPIAFPYSLVD